MIFLFNKKITVLIVVSLILITAGCGGGASTGSGGGGGPFDPAPNFTPTIPQPTPTTAPNTRQLIGSIYDITTSNVIIGSTLNINGTSFINTTGTYDFNFNPSGNNILTISGPNNITRETPIDPNMINQNFYLLPSGFNTTHLRAQIDWKDSADPNIVYNSGTVRWMSAPKIRLYSKQPDGSDASTHNTEYIKAINVYIALNYNTLKDITYEIFEGKPADDPDWIEMIGSTPTNYMGYINKPNRNLIGICTAPLTGAAGSTTPVFSDSQGKYLGGGITMAPVPNPINNAMLFANALHELGHALGLLPHPFEGITSTDWPTFLEPSIMNYSHTGKRTNNLSNYDKYILFFNYNRAPNNITPDKNTTLLVSSGIPDDIKIKTTTDPINF